MRRSPVIALLLALSFTFQLALARDGSTCVMPGTPHDQMAASAMGESMAGMSAMEMPTGTDDAPHSACDHDAASRTCLVIAPCAGGFLAVPATIREHAHAVPERVAAAAIVRPSSHTRAPELPPPRA